MISLYQDITYDFQTYGDWTPSLIELKSQSDKVERSGREIGGQNARFCSSRKAVLLNKFDFSKKNFISKLNFTLYFVTWDQLVISSYSLF